MVPSARCTRVVVECDVVDLRLVERDAVVQLAVPRPHDLLHLGEPEGDEQETGLVDVPVVLVDDGDLDLSLVVGLAEAVRHQRAAGAAAQDHDLLRHRLPPPCPVLVVCLQCPSRDGPPHRVDGAARDQ